ncbi:MAG: hypothetical protein R3C02_17215 [Planctomycetaceae bacterium]
MQTGLSYSEYADTRHSSALWKFNGNVNALSGRHIVDSAIQAGEPVQDVEWTHKRAIPIRFEYRPPELTLTIDGDQFDLTSGRVFVIPVEGAIRQLDMDPPSVDEHSSIDQVASRIQKSLSESAESQDEREDPPHDARNSTTEEKEPDQDEPNPGDESTTASPPAEEPAADTGSELLRRIRAASAPVLADMSENHGYGLKPSQAVQRVAPPFPDVRMDYYLISHPSQAEAIPDGPSGMVFRWENDKLRNWSMTFGGRDGYSMTEVFDALLGIKSQEIEGEADLLNQGLPGDWIVRTDAAKEDVLEQLTSILRDELNLNVRLEFRTVKRDVYVATDRYEFTPLAGQKGEGELQLTDEKIQTDRVQIFGKELKPNSGAGGGTGEFDEFLGWLGRWIDAPIVSEVTERPSRQISWRLHENSFKTHPSRRDAHEAERREAHDADLVLKNITKQTNLRFTKETRPIPILFVERR